MRSARGRRSNPADAAGTARSRQLVPADLSVPYSILIAGVGGTGWSPSAH